MEWNNQCLTIHALYFSQDFLSQRCSTLDCAISLVVQLYVPRARPGCYSWGTVCQSDIKLYYQSEGIILTHPQHEICHCLIEVNN